MATFNIPVPPEGVAKWQVRVDFEGTFYRILYKRNVRNDSWYFDLGDDSGVALVRSRRIVLASDILRDFRHRTIPQGVFSIIDTTGEHKEPTFEDLGERVLFQYTEADE